MTHQWQNVAILLIGFVLGLSLSYYSFTTARELHRQSPVANLAANLLGIYSLLAAIVAGICLVALVMSGVFFCTEHKIKVPKEDF